MNQNVLILSLCQALLVTGNILLVSVSALIGKQLAPFAEVITLPVALQFIGLMVATLPASLIMDKTGRKKGFLLGNTIGISGALIAMLGIYISSFTLYCAGTFLIGIGIGFGNLYRFAALEVCHPEKKSQALSLTMAGGVLAAVLGPNLAVYSQRLFPEPPFFAAFLILTLLYIIALALISRIRIPEITKQHSSQTGRPMVEIATQPIFILAVTAATVGYSVMVLIMTATPIAMQGCGFGFDDAAWVIEWHVIGMFAPSFFTGKLIQRFGLLTVLTVGALLNLACIFINIHGQTYEHFMSALILLGIGWNFMFIAGTQLVTQSYTDEEKSKTQGVNELLVFGVVTVCALASGWMEATLGWELLNLSMLPFILVAMLLILWYHLKTRESLDTRA